MEVRMMWAPWFTWLPRPFRLWRTLPKRSALFLPNLKKGATTDGRGPRPYALKVVYFLESMSQLMLMLGFDASWCLC